MLTPATRLGPYEIVSSLGAGGMGQVYRARDPKLGRDVAIKVLPAHLAADPERRERFEREARTVAALNHPHIVTIHSIEEAAGSHFLTMELVEGRTLADLIPQGGVPGARLLDAAIPLSDAVAVAHQKGITHRDLKPSNVMVRDDGWVKVLDFGLAKLKEVAPEPAGLTAMPRCSPGKGAFSARSRTCRRNRPKGSRSTRDPTTQTNLWVQPLDGRPARQLTHFTDGRTHRRLRLVAGQQAPGYLAHDGDQRDDRKH